MWYAQPVKNRRPRGASLVELILSVGILGVLMLSMSRIMVTGYHYYWTSVGSLDVQRAALLTSRRISKELSLSNVSTVIAQPGAIVFATPLDANEVPRYASDGNIEWQSHVCFYLETIENQSVLIRKRVDVNTPGVNPPDPIADGHTIAFFAGAPDPQIVARGVAELEATIETDTVQLSVTGSTQSRGQFEMTVINKVFPRN